MGQSRIDLHELLTQTLNITAIYFQPPSNISLTYPCAVYSRVQNDTKYAANQIYGRKVRYQITVIDRDPDSGLHEKLLNIPYCSMEKHFLSDNLNHDVYNLYF